MNKLEDIVENESPEILELRWQNAVRVAKKINALMDLNFIIMNEHGEVLLYKFTITEDEIYMKFSKNGINGYFLKDIDSYNGYYTPIDQYNAMFDEWTFIEPKNVGNIKELII